MRISTFPLGVLVLKLLHQDCCCCCVVGRLYRRSPMARVKLTPEVDIDCQLALVWELESQSPASANWNDTEDATVPCWTVALVPVSSVTFSRTLYVPVIR